MEFTLHDNVTETSKINGNYESEEEDDERFYDKNKTYSTREQFNYLFDNKQQRQQLPENKENEVSESDGDSTVGNKIISFSSNSQDLDLNNSGDKSLSDESVCDLDKRRINGSISSIAEEDNSSNVISQQTHSEANLSDYSSSDGVCSVGKRSPGSEQFDDIGPTDDQVSSPAQNSLKEPDKEKVNQIKSGDSYEHLNSDFDDEIGHSFLTNEDTSLDSDHAKDYTQNISKENELTEDYLQNILDENNCIENISQRKSEENDHFEDITRSNSPAEDYSRNILRENEMTENYYQSMSTENGRSDDYSQDILRYESPEDNCQNNLKQNEMTENCSKSLSQGNERSEDCSLNISSENEPSEDNLSHNNTLRNLNLDISLPNKPMEIHNKKTDFIIVSTENEVTNGHTIVSPHLTKNNEEYKLEDCFHCAYQPPGNWSDNELSENEDNGIVGGIIERLGYQPSERNNIQEHLLSADVKVLCELYNQSRNNEKFRALDQPNLNMQNENGLADQDMEQKLSPADQKMEHKCQSVDQEMEHKCQPVDQEMEQFYENNLEKLRRLYSDSDHEDQGLRIEEKPDACEPTFHIEENVKEESNLELTEIDLNQIHEMNPLDWTYEHDSDSDQHQAIPSIPQHSFQNIEESNRDKRKHKKLKKQKTKNTILTVPQPYINRCNKCSTLFSSQTELQSHYRSCNVGVRVFRCASCDVQFFGWELFTHMKERHARYICLQCAKMYPHPDKLSNHINNKHRRQHQLFNCLREFYLTHKDEGYLLCCDCETLFSADGDFYCHNCQLMNSSTHTTSIVFEGKIDHSRPPTKKKKNIPIEKKQGSLKLTFKKNKNSATIIKRSSDDEHVRGESDYFVAQSEETERTLPRITCKIRNPDKIISSSQSIEDSINRVIDSFRMELNSSDNVDQEIPSNTVVENTEENKVNLEENYNSYASVNYLHNDIDSFNDNHEIDEPQFDKNQLEEPEVNDEVEENRTKEVTNENISEEGINKEEFGEHTPEKGLNREELDESDSGDVENILATHETADISSNEIQTTTIFERDEENENDKSLQRESNNEEMIEVDTKPVFQVQSRNISDNESDEGSDKLTIALDQPVEDQLPPAGEDIPFIYIAPEENIENMKTIALIKLCVKNSCWNCVFCAHAKRIAVNGKQIGLHLLSEHRFTTQTEDEEQKLNCFKIISSKIEESLDELDKYYFNTDTFDSSDMSTWKANDKLYECYHCLFASYVHKELYNHNRKMHQKAVFFCIMCKSNFYNHTELLCHLCTGIYTPGQVINPDIKYRCYICDTEPLPSSFRLMVHLRKIHNSCDICFDISVNQFQLSAHVQKHKMTHMCYRCGIAYKNKPDITKHLYWKHGTESILCKRCLQKKWPHVYHFCIPPAAFFCDICNGSFTKAIALKVHKRIHSDDFRYTCDTCSEKFISRKLLCKHKDKHEEDNQQPEINVTDDAEKMDVDVTTEEKEPTPMEVENEEEEKKEVTDVFDLPPVNLSESDDSDDEKLPSPVNTNETCIEPEPSTSVEPPEPVAPALNGVWDSFKSYIQDQPSSEVPSSVKSLMNKHMSMIMLADHDYCCLQPNKPKEQEHSEVDHTYCGNSDATNVTNDKQETEKTKEKSSSSSDSSTDSDTSSSSECKKTNCSCCTSSSSSGSSSSSSNGSRNKKRTKKKRKSGSSNEVTVHDELPTESVIPAQGLFESLIHESDLETSESQTDEDWYDYNPALIASKVLAEKRNQLVNVLNNCLDPISARTTPTELNIETQQRKKLKSRKKRSQLAKKGSHTRPKTVKPIKLSNIVSNNGYGNVVASSTPLLSTLLQHNTTSDNMDTPTSENEHRPKRKRVPLKLYGFTSDEDGEIQSPLIHRRKEKKEPSYSPIPTIIKLSKHNIPTISSEPTSYWDITPTEPPVTPKIQPIKIRTTFGSKQNSPFTGGETFNSYEFVRSKPPVNQFALNGNSIRTNEKIYCFCQCPYDEVSEMIACDAKDCKIEWFHFECVGIMVPPKGKWYCPDCKKKAAAEREFMPLPFDQSFS